MTDIEKVIKGLEQFRNDFKPFCGNHADWERFDAGLSMLKEQNTRRCGKWKTMPHKKARVCSVCEKDEPYKFADDDADVYEYCPHCGAKMV